MDQRRKELLFQILSIMATGTVVASVLVAPGILLAIAPFIAKKTRSDDRQVYRALRYAKQQKWIRILETNGGIRAEITTRGRRRWQYLHFDQPLTGTRWDGKWRIVIFDIPNKRKSAREGVRGALKKMGFYQLQESVWVSAWPCESHIEALRNFYLIPTYVQMIETPKIEHEAPLLSKFNLKR